LLLVPPQQRPSAGTHGGSHQPVERPARSTQSPSSRSRVSTGLGNR
jgi:hypothetical protein